ncbi:MAG: cell wall hydrolase [Sphingobium sp.]
MIGLGAIAALLGLGGAAHAVLEAAPLSLDLLARQPEPALNPVENPRETFTGSAYFFADGAFDIAPQAEMEADSPHILVMRRVDQATALRFSGATALDRYRALNCLTSAIYYEAANEPDEGQRAVAQVVLNRVRHPAWPKSVCGVVYQGAERTDLLCQFTFSCDGAMARAPVADKWARARRTAEAALAGRIFPQVGLSTFYHTLAVRPEWSSRLDAVAVVGAHIFYQMRGINGQPAAFHTPYSGRELISGPPPRPWKPLPVGAIPTAMPYLPELETAIGGASSAPASVAPDGMTAPSGGTPLRPPSGGVSGGTSTPADQGPPQSTIRPEYENSGRPLI